MKTLVIALSLMLFSAAHAASPPAHPTQLEAGLTNPGYQEKPAWFKESFLDLRDDLNEAKTANKRVILYFYQDGCPYCTKLLQDNFGKAEIADKTRKNFEVIAINMWGDRDVTDLDGKAATEKTFAAAQQVQYTPTLLFLDESGKVVLRVNGYYAPDKFNLALDFVAGKHDKTGSFRDYFAKLKAEGKINPPSKEYVLPRSLPQPLRLQAARKGTGRPLMVVFAKADECDTCAELFDDIFKRENLVYSLGGLDVAQANPDADTLIQTPDGKETKLNEWAKALGIKYSPSLVFFDTDGKEVFRTEAYLKAFHIHGALDYVATGAYRAEPEFQRYLQHRRAVLEAHGLTVDLMK